jgi:RNA polymerase sigma-70 factor (ECF subfamily)
VESPTDDDQLLMAAASDAEAFAAFYRRHARGLLAFFASRTRDAEAAADLTAETFAAALEGCHRYRADRGPAAGWLYGIARHQLAMLHRRGAVEDRARRRLGVPRLELSDAELERIAAETPAVEALAMLPADQRAAIEARVLHERSYGEIAAATATSEPAARQRVSRGLAALRAILRGEAP